ncbi:hypothetical protein BAXH7_04167 [Bacillus amyloliquefaciens XH7]|nr:hypothetical protein BAXH7_04167 [Bacillus amyloliquefaciens XH7]KYC92388.1 hypothetical protein B425_4039 [Bacillus amyloliquefaciens]
MNLEPFVIETTGVAKLKRQMKLPAAYFFVICRLFRFQRLL